MTDAVLTTRDGDIITWTLNRPEARNPISEPDVIEALENAVAEVNGDPSVRAAIITGSGSAFSSGGNVKHMQNREGMFGGSPPKSGRATDTASSGSHSPCTTARYRPSPPSTGRQSARAATSR